MNLTISCSLAFSCRSIKSPAKQLKEGRVGMYSLLQQGSQGSLKEVVRWCRRKKRVGTLGLISKGTVKKPTKWKLHDLGIMCLL